MILPLAWGAALCPISRESPRETSQKPERLPARATDAFPLAELEAELPLNRELIFASCVSGKAGTQCVLILPFSAHLGGSEGAALQSLWPRGQMVLVVPRGLAV